MAGCFGGGGRVMGATMAAILAATLFAAQVVADLGELEGLQRVASIFGLAVCLLVVSLLYQRFVFRRPEVTTDPAAPGNP